MKATDMRHIVIAIALFGGVLSGQTLQPVKFYNPAWSPDGERIALESSRDSKDGRLAVFTVRRDGAELRRLTSPEFTAEQPSWSPDGKRIVFSTDIEGDRKLFLMDADGSNAKAIPNTLLGFYATFSPDGRWILFAAQDGPRAATTRVVLIRPDGSDRRVLGDSTTSNEGPRWATDGKRVIYTEVPMLQPNPGESMRDLAKRRNSLQHAVSTSLNGTDKRTLSEEEARHLSRDPAITSDGRWEALVKHSGDSAEVVVRDRSNGKEARIVPR
jgi:dipeptidyl aminopeptidase/acylaminoacyl peptidase